MEKYKIKDFTRMLGITTKTIYFYEKHKIITPFIDPNNGYRYFDFKDAERIVVAKRLSKMGFSIKETSKLINNINVEEYNNFFITKLDDLEKEIQRKTILYNRMKKYTDELEIFKDKTNILELENEDIYFVPHLENERFIDNKETLEDIKILMENAEFVFKLKMPDFDWGMGIYKKDSDSLNLNLKTKILIPEGRFITYPYIKQVKRKTNTVKEVNNLMEDLSKKYKNKQVYMVGSFDFFDEDYREKHFLIYIRK